MAEDDSVEDFDPGKLVGAFIGILLVVLITEPSIDNVRRKA
jgi:hypothetical protein